MTCLDEIFTFGLEIACIGAPVYFWIFKRDNVSNHAVHDVLVSQGTIV